MPSAAAAAAAAPRTAPSSSLYSHVSSRLHEETVSTIAKKKLPTAGPSTGGGGGGRAALPGATASGGGGASDLRGAVNLTALPPPGLHPMAMPLGTLLPPRYGVPGPLTASAFEVVPGEYRSYITWGPRWTGFMTDGRWIYAWGGPQ